MEGEGLIRMGDSVWRRVTVKGLGRDRSPIRRKSAGFPLSDVSCLLSLVDRVPKRFHPSLGRCPRPPLASDWTLSLVPLASTRLTSFLDPRLPVHPPLSVLRLAPLRLHRMFFRRSPFHIARGQFGTNSTFVLYHGCRCTLHPHGPYLYFRNLMFHPFPVPSCRLTAPFLTIPYGLAVS